jgi:hypothetical protein
MGETVVEIIGWAGSIIVLIAYALNSYKKLKSDSVPFQVMNLIGGISLIVYSVYKDAFANTFINIAWVLIAIVTITKVLIKKKN